MRTPNATMALIDTVRAGQIAKKKKVKPESPEAKFAREVIGWLTAQDWDCYQEVNLGQSLPTADIVAIRGGVSMVVETKVRFCLDVIGQADYWRHRANFVCIATPHSSRKYASQQLIEDLLKWRGIGWIVAQGELLSYGVQPRLFRARYGQNVKLQVREEHKHYAAAGSKEGGRFTPYQQTCRAILTEAIKNPGITTSDLLTRIQHHYGTDKTARNCIVKWGLAGAIRGVRAIKKNDGKVRFYPLG